MSSRRPFLELEDGYTKYADLKARYDELSAKHQSVKRKRTEERRELAKLRKRTKGVAEQFDSTLIDDSDSDEIHHGKSYTFSEPNQRLHSNIPQSR